MRKIASLWVLVLLAALCLSGFAACKGTGGGAADTVATPASEATATEGATRITDATVLATHVWEQPTTIIKVEGTPVEETPTPASADDKLIARGQMLYEKKGCNECHGDSGEGLSDKGAKLAGTSLTEAEFKDILRTGGKGRLGNEHIFGISAISESGIKAVYAFLQSLEP